MVASLGAPSKVFYKTEDKMLIQRGSESESIHNQDKADIFYNYFTLGLVSFSAKYLFIPIAVSADNFDGSSRFRLFAPLMDLICAHLRTAPTLLYDSLLKTA